MVCYRKICFLAVIIVILFTGPPSFSEPLDIDALIEKIQGIYEETGDLRAEFIHQVPLQVTGKTFTEEGTFYFKKPGRMCWDYEKPPLKKLVINPEKTWFYIPEDNRVYVQETDDVLISQIAIRFFSGIGNLRENFGITYSEPRCHDEDGNYMITLKPKEYDEGIQELELLISGESFYVIGYNLKDMYGNLNRYIFKNIRVNNDLPESLFHFTPPAGAEIQETF
ncbi:MAG: outer membrane lipoprotein carrier protein LolA [Deltaproteobacteria bacterium]|nr:outer membrane lipoprotein carrier protein LolA [Deltaproteobacteria bacterium]MBN2846544.1 outer membrane lipoprotein carrier protein LolA [Deltaproteobacteria bacterium]